MSSHSVYVCQTIVTTEFSVLFLVRCAPDLDDDANIVATLFDGDEVVVNGQFKDPRDPSMIWMQVVRPVTGYLLYTLQERMYPAVPREAIQRGSAFKYLRGFDPNEQLPEHSVYVCQTNVSLFSKVFFRIRSAPELDDDSNEIALLTNGDEVVANGRFNDPRDPSMVWLRVVKPVSGYLLYTLQGHMHEHVPREAIDRRSAFKLQHTFNPNDRSRNLTQCVALCKGVPITSSTPPSGCLVLYHQTSPDNAAEILSSGRMCLGSQGSQGPGVYFACSAEETHRKARSSGVVLKCLVYIGREKVVTSLAHRSIAKLVAHGYDSVRYDGFASGREYVVYSAEQVLRIERA